MDENKVIDVNADDVKRANKNGNKRQQLRRKRSAHRKLLASVHFDSGKILSIFAYSNILIVLRHIFFIFA